VDEDHRDSWLTKLGQHSRDTASIVLLVVSLSGVWWVLKNNTVFQKGVADIAGVTELKLEVAGLRQAIEDSTKQTVMLGDQLQRYTEDSIERSRVASQERDAVAQRVARMERTLNTNQDTLPAIKYSEFGNRIEALSPGEPIRIGDYVRLTWRLVKMRECGEATARDFIVDVNGVTAQLVGVSTRDQQGRGLVLPPDPNAVREITYTARIPKDAGLSPGVASVWIAIRYDPNACPKAASLESPRISFYLAEAQKG
jgi:hypothetical protein